MIRKQYLAPLATGGALLAMVLGVMLINATRGNAKDDDDRDPRIRLGLAITPVRLRFDQRDRERVGLGSYLVNAVGGCNDCHTNPPYRTGGDPFMGEPKKVNASQYLAGGNEFIPAHPPDFPAVVSRNLTPDKTGRPAGGASYWEFRSLIRTGLDRDRAHPQYGPYLQVMPWPVYQNLSEEDLQAIYVYLSAIPCVEGEPGLPHPRPTGTRCK